MWERGITLTTMHVHTAQQPSAMLLLLLTLQSLFVACQGQFNLQMLRQHMNAGRAFPQQLLNNRFQNFNSQHLRNQNGPVHAQQRFQIPNLAANASPQINSIQPGFPGSSGQVSSQMNRSWQQQQIQSAGVQGNPMQQPPTSQNVPNTRSSPLADPNLVQKQLHEFQRLQVMLRHIQQQRQRQQEQQRRQQQQQQEQQRRQQILQRIQAIQRARAQGLTTQTGGSGHSAKINQMEKMIRDMIKYRDQLKQEAAFRQKTRQVDATNLLHREDVQSGPSILVMDKDIVTAIPVVTTKKPNASLGQSMIVFAKTANIHSNVESQTNNAGDQPKADPKPQTTTTTTTTTAKPVLYQNPGFQQLGIQHPLPKMSHQHLVEPPQQQNLHIPSTQSHQPIHQQQQTALPANSIPTLLQSNVIAGNGRVNSPQTNTHHHQQNNHNGNQALDKPTNHHANPSQRRNSQHHEPVMRQVANQNHRSPHVNQHPLTNHVQSSRPTQMELPPLGTVQQNSHMFHQRTDPPPIQLPTLNMLSVNNQGPIMQPVQQQSSRKSPVQSPSSNNPLPEHIRLPSSNNHMQTFISTEPPNQWKQARPTTTPIPDVPKMYSHGNMQKPLINRRLLKRPPRPRIVTTPEPLFHQDSLTHHSRVHTGPVQHEVQTVPPVVTELPHRFVPTSPPNTTPKPSINDMFNRMSRPRPQKVRISFRKSASLSGSLSGGVLPPQITTPSFPAEPTPVPFIPTQSNNIPEPTTTPVVPTQPNFPPVHQEVPQYHKPIEHFQSLPPPLPTVEQVQNFQMNSHHQYPVRQPRVTTEPSIRYYTTTESSYHHQQRTHQSEQIVPVPFSHPLPGFNQNHNAHMNSYIPPTTTTTQAPLHLSDLQKWESEMKINSRTPVARNHQSNNGAMQAYHQVTTTEAPRVHPPAPTRAENPLAKLLKLLQRKNASIKFASDRKNQQQFKEPRPQPQRQTTTTESPVLRVPAPKPQNRAPFSRHSSELVPRHRQVPQNSHWSQHRTPTEAPSTNLQSARNNFKRFEMSPFSTSLPLNNHKTRLQPTAVPIAQPPSQRQRSRGIPTEQSNLRHRNFQHTRNRVHNNVRPQPQRANVVTKSPGPVNPAQLLIAALIQALQSGNLLKQLQRQQQQSTQFQHQSVQESEPVMTHTQMNSPTHHNEQQSQPAMHMEEPRHSDVPYYNMEETQVQQQQHIPQEVDRQQRFENQNNHHHQVIRYNTEAQQKPPKNMPDLSMLQGQDVEFTDVNTGFGGESPPPVIIQRIPKNSRTRSNGDSVSYELPSMALHENSAVVIDTSTGDDSNSTSDNTEEKKNSTDDKDMDLPKLSTIFASKITTKSPPSGTTPETTVESIKLPELDTEKPEDKQEENMKIGGFKNADDQENGKSFNFQLPSLSPINLDYETNEVSTPPPLFAMTKNVQKNENDKDDLKTTTPSTTAKPTTTEKTISTTVKDISTVTQDQSTASVVPVTSMSRTTTISKIEDDSYDKTPKTTPPTTTTKISTSTTPSTTTTANAQTTKPTSTSTPITTISTTTTTSKPTQTAVKTTIFSTTTTTPKTTTTMLPTTTTTQMTTTEPTTQMKTTTQEYKTTAGMSTVIPTLPQREKEEEKEYITTSTTMPTPETSTRKQKTQETTTTTVYDTSPFFFMTTMDYRALYPELFGLRPLMHESVEPSTTTHFTTTTTPTTTSTSSTTAASTTTLRPTTTTAFKPTAIETTPKPTTTTYKTTTTSKDFPTSTTIKPIIITPAWQSATTHFTTDAFSFTLPTTIDYRDLFAEMFGRKPVPGILGAQESALERKTLPETTLSPVTTTTATQTTTSLPPAPQKTAYVGLSLENAREYRKATNISPTVLSNTVEKTLPLLSLPSPTVRDVPRSFVSDNLNGGHGLQPQTVRSTTPRSVRVLGRDIVIQTTAQSFAANHLSGSGQQGVNDQPANHISDFVQNGNAGSLSQQRIIQRQMSVPETMNNVLSPHPTPHVDVVDIPYDPHLDRAATLLSGNRIPDQYTDPKVASSAGAPTKSSKSANEPLNVIDLNAFSTNSLAANPDVEHSQQSNPVNGVADVSTQLDSLLSALGSDIMIHEQKSNDGHVQYKIHGGNKDLPAFVLRTGYKWADTFG